MIAVIGSSRKIIFGKWQGHCSTVSLSTERVGVDREGLPESLDNGAYNFKVGMARIRS